MDMTRHDPWHEAHRKFSDAHIRGPVVTLQHGQHTLQVRQEFTDCTIAPLNHFCMLYTRLYIFLVP